MREFIDTRLPTFASQNPQLTVETVHRNNRHPFVQAEYGQSPLHSTRQMPLLFSHSSIAHTPHTSADIHSPLLLLFTLLPLPALSSLQ